MSRVITSIFWEPGQGFDPRASTTFSDATKIRLDPADHEIKLRLQPDFRYPTDLDLHIRSRSIKPEAVRKLLMLHINGERPRDADGNAPTSIQLRLFDGTDERFFNGSSWAIAGPSDWNDEATVNDNIQTFDVSSRQFAVVLNLATTDDRLTPSASSVFVLWEGEVDWIDDILTDSLAGMLQQELDWIVDLALPPLPAASATIDLDDYTEESGLTLIGADAVFDHTSDPNHLSNLLSSFDVPTQVLTLSSAIPVGNVPFVRLKAKVQVAWDTHQDFVELGKLPQIVLRDAENVGSSSYPLWSRAGIVDKDSGAAVEVPPPYRATYQVTMEVRTDRSREQARLQESIMRLLTAGPASEVGPFVRSRATDRRYRLFLTDEFRAVAPRLDLEASGVRTHRVELQIRDVALELQPAIDTFMVKTLKLNLANVTSDAEQLASGLGVPIPSTPVESFDVS